jgi:SAM-dependent methyltransferase
MERPDWAPSEVDPERPSAARMWDYLLGGAHNFAADRRVAEQAVAFKPDLPELAREVRAFIHRAVAFLSEAGIDQFIDIGSGIPTRGNVHEKAQQLNPAAKVLYVDHDPVAIAHSQAILRDNSRAAAVLGDLRDPGAILKQPEVHELLDLDRPVGLLLISVLHFVFDEYDPKAIVATLRDALAPGSYLVIQHASADEQPEDTLKMLEYFNSQSPEPMRWRTREQITEFFEGFTILEPGVVFLTQWRPDPDRHEPDPVRFASYTAIGRKE